MEVVVAVVMHVGPDRDDNGDGGGRDRRLLFCVDSSPTITVCKQAVVDRERERIEDEFSFSVTSF